MTLCFPETNPAKEKYMKILMLTPYLPYPLHSGGQTRSFNLIKNLSQNHEITLFSFIRREEEKGYIKNLLPFCKKIKVFKRRKAWSLINMILAAITPFPFLVVIYLSRTLRQALIQELGTQKYDLIHAETFYVMPNIPKTKLPVLLVEQTIEYQVYQHFRNELPFILVRLPVALDVWKVKFWERFFWNKASKVIAVSQNDKQKMVNLNPRLGVEVVPNGVDSDSFKMNPGIKSHKDKNKPTILYVGNFKWLQNREAVEILIKEIWPEVKKSFPQAKLWIVGRGIGIMKNFASRDISFDESVDDISTSYNKADLMIAPIRGPGGTRLKVLESLASGCPVVTTPVGIEGIGTKDGAEVLIGRTSKEIAEKSIMALNNDNLRKTMIVKGRQFVVQNYDWNKITKKLEQIYEDVCKKNN